MLFCNLGKSFVWNQLRYIRNQVNTNSTSIRYLHYNQLLKAKIYVDSENSHAHQILEQSLKPYQLFSMYEQTDIVNQHSDILPNTTNYRTSKQTTVELLTDLKNVAVYCKNSNTLISNQSFKDFAERFCSTVHLLSDEELLESLRLLALLPQEENPRSSNFMQLWNVLDIECSKRLDRWSYDHILLVCDAWYKLYLARISEYLPSALRKLGRKPQRMTQTQMVQTMFYCNILRKSVFDMFDFEENIWPHFKQMTTDELGIVAMGFFKSQSVLRNPELLDNIYQRVTDEIDSLSDITLVALLKILRYSSRLPQIDQMVKLLDRIAETDLARRSLLTCLHIALLGRELHYCHDGLLERIFHRFDSDLLSTRIKDLERICLVMSFFNLKAESGIEEKLCKKILAELNHRIEEIIKYPKCFTNCLHYITICGYHNTEMLETVFEAKFLKRAMSANVMNNRELFHLDTYTKVNLKADNYSGAHLTDKQRGVMGKMLTHYIPERGTKYKLNKTDSILLEIRESLQTLVPHVALKHILPIYERSDIVFFFDKQQRKCLPIAANCPEDYSGVILFPEQLVDSTNTDHIDKIVIVIAGWNSVLRKTERHTGLFDMKLKQLQLLGYKYIVVYWHEWRNLETHSDRIDFIKRRLVAITNACR